MSKELSKLELLENKGKLSRVDVNISVNFMDKLGVADVFGTKYTLKTPEAFLDRIAKLGIETKGVHYKSDSWFNELSEEVEIEVVITPEEGLVDELLIVTPTVEELIVETPIEPKEVGVVKATLDLAFIESLKNNKQDKEALDKYARETFSIELNQSLTLKNMIKDLEAKL